MVTVLSMREIAHLLMKKVHRRVAWKRMVVDYCFSRFRSDGPEKQWNPEILLAFTFYNVIK